MGQQAFTWFAHFSTQIAAMPSDYQDEYIIAIARYGMYGEEPEFTNPLLAACFEGVRSDIDNSVKNRSENKGGRPSKTKVKTRVSKTGKPPSETLVSESEKPPSETIEDEKNKPNLGLASLSQAKEGEPPYPLACLKIFNETMGTTYSRNPHGEFLADFENLIPLEDVRRMVEFKRDEWMGTRFQANLTPNTLFAPNHFEAYVNQAKMPPPTREGVTSDDELASYDA